MLFSDVSSIVLRSLGQVPWKIAELIQESRIASAPTSQVGGA